MGLRNQVYLAEDNALLQVVEVANKYKKDKYRFAIADEEEFAKELAEVSCLFTTSNL